MARPARACPPCAGLRMVGSNDSRSMRVSEGAGRPMGALSSAELGLLPNIAEYRRPGTYAGAQASARRASTYAAQRNTAEHRRPGT